MYPVCQLVRCYWIVCSLYVEFTMYIYIYIYTYIQYIYIIYIYIYIYGRQWRGFDACIKNEDHYFAWNAASIQLGRSCQCPVKLFVGLHEVRGQPRFETRSLYHFMFKGEGGVVHGKMASAHFMCVTLLGNPYVNKQLICFRFKKISDIQLQSTIYCPIYYCTQMSFIYLVLYTVKNLYIIKFSQFSSMSKK